MKARLLWISGALAVALAVVAWLTLRPSASPDAASSAAAHSPELADPLVVDPQPAAPAPLAPSTATEAASLAAPAPSDPAATIGKAIAPATANDPAADERTVLGMYQNMTDAVDAYGKDACPALGQAFGTFVSDALPAIGRLVRASKANGQDFNTTFAATHAAQLVTTQAKLKEAVARCGTDPGMITALQTLARQR
jgi:hypothetical protein